MIKKYMKKIEMMMLLNLQADCVTIIISKRKNWIPTHCLPGKCFSMHVSHDIKETVLKYVKVVIKEQFSFGQMLFAPRVEKTV